MWSCILFLLSSQRWGHEKNSTACPDWYCGKCEWTTANLHWVTAPVKFLIWIASRESCKIISCMPRAKIVPYYLLQTEKNFHPLILCIIHSICLFPKKRYLSGKTYGGRICKYWSSSDPVQSADSESPLSTLMSYYASFRDTFVRAPQTPSIMSFLLFGRQNKMQHEFLYEFYTMVSEFSFAELLV